LVNWPAVVIPI